MKRRSHSKEFKEEAVKLTENMPLMHVARDLGINHSLLGKWKSQLEVSPVNAFTGKSTPEQEEIKRLKKELYEMTIQRDILKKAVAIFSK
jgi:transposase